MKGSQHLFSLAMAAESVTRLAYRTDVMATYRVDGADRNMAMTLEACDTLEAIVAEIRAAREVQS